jgi:hypothetical protein
MALTLASNAITFTDNTVLSSGVITAAQLSAGSITTSAIASGAITTEKIALGAVVTEDLADSAVTTNKIASSAVTSDKLPVGSVVKTEYAELVGWQSYSSGQTLAVGATPTITSGVEILAVNSLSTNSASNYLIITANALLATSSGTSVILMLFAGNTLIATANGAGQNQASIMTLSYKHLPASTSAVNYTVRAACETGTLYVNRLYTVTDYNTGKQVSSMVIQEIKG